MLRYRKAAVLGPATEQDCSERRRNKPIIIIIIIVVKTHYLYQDQHVVLKMFLISLTDSDRRCPGLGPDPGSGSRVCALLKPAVSRVFRPIYSGPCSLNILFPKSGDELKLDLGRSPDLFGFHQNTLHIHHSPTASPY